MSKKGGPMTKAELGHAGVLHMIWWQAHRIADEIDPERTWENLVSTGFDRIRDTANYTFTLMTGQPCRRVTSADLNTETPAAWTQLPLKEREVLELPHVGMP